MIRYPGCPCFWLEPTGKMQVQLRRFTFSVAVGEEESKSHRNCPATTWGHGAEVLLDEEHDLITNTEYGGKTISLVPDELTPPHDDPRWPTVCEACGEPFREDDQWQTNQIEVYVRSDTEERVATRGYNDKSMVGALFDAWWLHPSEDGSYVPYSAKVVDGIVLMAICPNGCEWVVDGEATGGGFWSRTGDPRRPETLTVTPSIVAGDYHGFLQAGRFTDDLGS